MSKKLLEHLLLNGVTSNSDGTWFDVSSWRRIAVHVKLTDTPNLTVKIYGSNEPTKPSNSSDEVQIGSDITSDTIVELSVKLKWVKAKIINYVAGTVNAYAVGESTAYGL